MPIIVTCDCGAVASAPDATAGGQVVCPQCGATVVVPITGAGLEVVEAAPANTRPRRPSRRRLWLAVVATVAAVVLLAVLTLRDTSAGRAIEDRLWGRTPPPGYAEARDRACGYRVFLPGLPQKMQVRLEGPETVGTQSGFASNIAGTSISLFCILPAQRFTAGDTPDQLFALLQRTPPTLEAAWNEIESKEVFPVGGRSGLLVKLKEKKDWVGGGKPWPEWDVTIPAHLPPDQRKGWEDRAAARKRDRDAERKRSDEAFAKNHRREVYVLATDNTRLVTIHFASHGEYVPDAVVKTVTESLEFR